MIIKPSEIQSLEYILNQSIRPHAPDMGNNQPQKILQSKRNLLDLLERWREPQKITIIAGSRTIGPSDNKPLYQIAEELMIIFTWCNKCPWPISKVLSGTAKGVDTAGEWWATANEIPVERHPARWDLYKGKSAGPIRNEEMAKIAHGLIMVWDGKSKGSKNMLELADKYALELHVLEL